MKILMHGYFGWYGSMAEWIRTALLGCGHHVDILDRNERANAKDYDLYFVVDCSENFSHNVDKSTDAIKIFWSMDAHMPGGIERARGLSGGMDLVLCSNYEHGVKLLRSEGIESVLLPITYVDNWVLGSRKPLKDRVYDIVMIGHPNSNERLQLWEIIKSLTSSFRIGRIDSQGDYINVMNEAKIVINQPTEPWDIIVNNRGYEAMGFGSLLLQKKLKTELLSKLGYKESEHYLGWNTLDELAPKLTEVLSHIEDYQPIADKGHQLVIKDSMTSQMRKLETIILDRFYDRL